MRKRAVFGSVVASSAVLAACWQLGIHDAIGLNSTAPVAASTSAPNAAAASPATTAPASAPAAAASPATTAPASAPAAAASGASGTFTGATEQTRYGTVQVSITVSNGSITDVTALSLTDADRKSVQISARAAPILRSEVLAAQSAKVDAVSGATYTTEGYLSSVQSAIDQAGL